MLGRNLNDQNMHDVYQKCLIAAMLGVVLAWLVLMATAIPMPQELPGLTLSRHAANAHLGQKWDAEGIRQTMSKGGCGPVNVYFCPDQDRVVYTCADPSKVGRLLGLVIGATSNLVVTGYPDSPKHWSDDLKGCILDTSGIGGLTP